MALRCAWSLPLALMMLLLLLCESAASSVPEIHAPWGALRGISLQGDGGRQMNAYLGIPYAMPPVGDLRYEKPQPHPGPSEGEVFEADKIMSPCPQAHLMIGSSKETSEDCLMLDVYVPIDDDTGSSTTKPYAVMVWIHGGGLIWGDAYTYRPSKLVADGKVIVVAMQYRLGVLGFLSSGDQALPGNLGLWDQNLALRWVNDNIPAFGGDPDRITIFGESAGSWSVGFHLLIPQSRGLFHRAIMQSGAPQYVMDYFCPKTVFKNLTEWLGCQGDSSQELVQCLKQQPVKHLMNISAEYEATSPLHNYYYPVVDGDLIPRHPRELLQDAAFMESNVGDVEVVAGFNKQEGGIILGMGLLGHLPMETLYTAGFFRENVDTCLLLTGYRKHPVLKQVTEFYYRGAETWSNMSQSLTPVVDLFGDCLMNTHITEWARYLDAAPHTAPRYMYILDHNFTCNSNFEVPGAHHGDDILLLFDVEREMPEDFIFSLLNKTSLSEEEKQGVSQKMVDVWTAFAKTGNPSGPLKADLEGGDWPVFTAEKEQYLSLTGSPRVVSHMGPYKDRLAFWLHLLPQLQAEVTKLPPTAEKEAAEKAPGPREDL